MFGDDDVLTIIILVTLTMLSFSAGLTFNDTDWERKVVANNCAHFDQKTAKFTWKDSGESK